MSRDEGKEEEGDNEPWQEKHMHGVNKKYILTDKKRKYGKVLRRSNPT